MGGGLANVDARAGVCRGKRCSRRRAPVLVGRSEPSEGMSLERSQPVARIASIPLRPRGRAGLDKGNVFSFRMIPMPEGGPKAKEFDNGWNLATLGASNYEDVCAYVCGRAAFPRGTGIGPDLSGYFDRSQDRNAHSIHTSLSDSVSRIACTRGRHGFRNLHRNPADYRGNQPAETRSLYVPSDG